jgi:glutathione peroxidase
MCGWPSPHGLVRNDNMGLIKKFYGALAAVPMLLAPAISEAQGGAVGSAYDFSFQTIDDKPMPLKGYKGNVLLVVNTASFCGFTQQYTGLQTLHEKYEGRGLVVIGVPSNDFGAQEPGSNAEIAKFCQGGFNITFPLASKETVKGTAAHPFYGWVRRVLGDGATPKWNFHKVLVGNDGQLIATFAATVGLADAKLIGAIEKALATRPGA